MPELEAQAAGEVYGEGQGEPNPVSTCWIWLRLLGRKREKGCVNHTSLGAFLLPRSSPSPQSRASLRPVSPSLSRQKGCLILWRKNSRLSEPCDHKITFPHSQVKIRLTFEHSLRTFSMPCTVLLYAWECMCKRNQEKMSNRATISQISFQNPLYIDREILIKVIFNKYFKSRLQRYNTVSKQRQKILQHLKTLFVFCLIYGGHKHLD